MLLDSFNITLEFGDGFPLTLGTGPQICFFFFLRFLKNVPFYFAYFLPDDAEFDALQESAKKIGGPTTSFRDIRGQS